MSRTHWAGEAAAWLIHDATGDMQPFAAVRRVGDLTLEAGRELLEGYRDEVLARLAERQVDLRAIMDKIIHYERLEHQHGHSDHQQ